MDVTTTPNDLPGAPANNTSGPRGRGRGGNRGRGRGGQTNGEAATNGTQREHRGGRRGGRGGNRGGAHDAPNALSAADLSARFSTPKEKLNPTVEPRNPEDGEEEAEVCIICASPVVHYALAPCNHRTCHICELRSRALYKKQECAQCRAKNDFVIFTDDPEKLYEDYTENDIKAQDTTIGIRYSSEDIQVDTHILLRYNCPDQDCDVACLAWPDLHRHVRSIHHKKICDLCSRHRQCFTHEHSLFTDRELHKHMTKGDDNPGAVDQSGFRGHPECGFCAIRFFDEDQLYAHCKLKHERCEVCDRRGGPPQYYQNYEELKVHFMKDHFMCPEQSCLDDKYIVFASEMDLKGHQLERHANTLSKDVRRDARVVNISSFDYRTPYVQERQGGRSQREQREGRGRGRGRDPNTEPLPASSAQPLGRAEQAYQRQMEIAGAQPGTARVFGGQLTPSANPAPPLGRAQAAPNSRSPPTIPAPQPSTSPTTAVRNLSLQEAATAPMTPQDQARSLRHRAVIERATGLLQSDQHKLGQFRDLISQFQRDQITAANLIDSFFALFVDTSSTALGTLIREVADLYEDKVKAQGLRTAWSDWRAINEDYPSLPVSTSTSSRIPLGWATTNASGSGASSQAKSTRILKLKSSTAQSSRSSVSQTRSWGAAPSLSSSSNPFPSLSAVSKPQGKVTTVPWVPGSSSSASSSASSSRPASVAPGKGKASDAFPALPPAKKPQSSIFGYGTGMVRRDGGGSASNAFTWGGSANEVPSAPQAGGEENEDAGKGKKKGNKGKKQVLMNWG